MTERNKRGLVIWFTGLPQAGKTTNANLVFDELVSRGHSVQQLDGDVVRKEITKISGFTKADRDENIRQAGRLARDLADQGKIVVASFVSPYQEIRRELRQMIENFVEVFVQAPLEVCEARDTKGMYKKARRGEIKHFTGIDDPYEPPENSELILRTDKFEIEECRDIVLKYLQERGFIE